MFDVSKRRRRIGLEVKSRVVYIWTGTGSSGSEIQGWKGWLVR